MSLRGGDTQHAIAASSAFPKPSIEHPSDEVHAVAGLQQKCQAIEPAGGQEEIKELQEETSNLAQRPGNNVNVGISDVAHAANVSTATVSRALRGLPRVSLETRQKVLAAASQLGYMPSPTASGLATGRTGIIGILTTTKNDLVNWQAVQAASRELNRRGYGLALFSLHDFNNSLELFLKTAKAKNRCDGLLVLGGKLKDEDIELLRVLPIPSATVDSQVSDTRLHAEGTKLAAEAIRQLFARVRVA